MIDISLFRSVANQYKHIRAVNTVSMMNTISHLIEDQVIQHRLAIDFHVGFQKFSNFPDQMRRYQRLGAICRRVYVYGVADYPPPNIAGVEFIEFSPASELAKEWFLFVNTPEFWTTLVARETAGIDQTTGGRRFDGIWSYDQQVSERISLLISQIMGGFYEPITKRNHEKQSAHITEISGSMLTQLEKTETLSQRRWTQVLTISKVSDICSQKSSNLIQQVADILHTIFGATSVAIALKQTDKEYAVSAVAGDAECEGWLVSAHNSISGQALQEARLTYVADVDQHHQRDTLLPRAKALVVAPIAHHSMAGIIAVGHRNAQIWSDEDARAVKVAADILAIFLSRVTQWAPKTALSLDPTKRFRQYVAENQRSLAYLIALHQKLRALDNLTDRQKSALRNIEDSYRQLVKVSNLAKQAAAEPAPNGNAAAKAQPSPEAAYAANYSLQAVPASYRGG
ncbi:MAG: GAF domain-containing protein [Leptolyngbya sp. SIO4C1]|nr:GAF domain-containing protein [Leptolyngbya sp. SIO4C1]